MESMIIGLNRISDSFIAFMWAQVWQSSLLIMLVMAAVLILRKASPRVRYLLWLLVIVRLILPPSLQIPTGIGTWGRQILKTEAGHKFFTAPQPISASVPAGIEDQPIQAPRAESLSLRSFLFLGWALGVVGIFLWVLAKLLKFYKILRVSAPPPPVICALIGKYSKEFDLKQEAKALVCDEITSPIVGGIFKPVIILPSAILDKLNEEELKPVIVHELAHIRRGDWIINWIQILAGILYFFHPLLWFANRQIKIEREKACDDLVLLTLQIERRQYAESLLRVFDIISGRRIFYMGFIGMAEPKSDLGRRIMRIMDKSITPRARLSIVSVLLVIVFGLCFMTFSGQTDKAEPADKTTRIRAKNFKDFYALLDNETKEKLQKQINIAFRSAPVSQILGSISSQVGIPITSMNLQKRHDLVHQNLSAKSALEILSLDQNWIWEKDGNNIIVYPARSEQDLAAIDSFFDQLDAAAKEKLAKPATLVFKSAPPDMIFQSLSKQTGYTIAAKDIYERIDCIFKDTPAQDILKILAMEHGWSFYKGDDFILTRSVQSVSPILRETADSKKEILVECKILKVSAGTDNALKEKIEEFSKGKRKEITPVIYDEWTKQKGIEVLAAPRMVILDGMSGTYKMGTNHQNTIEVNIKPIWKSDENITIEEMNGRVYIDNQEVPFEAKNIAQQPGKAYSLGCLRKAGESWYLIITLTLNK